MKIRQFFLSLTALIITLLLSAVIFGGGFFFIYGQFGNGLTVLQFFLKGLAVFVGFIFFSIAFWLIGLSVMKKLLKYEKAGK